MTTLAAMALGADCIEDCDVLRSGQTASVNTTVRVARTIRRRLLALPGRLTRSARRHTLHLPGRWPWQHDFIRALARMRALPAAA